jgi:hypothetical protein
MYQDIDIGLDTFPITADERRQLRSHLLKTPVFDAKFFLDR